jgi:folate-binding protein YgfZ
MALQRTPLFSAHGAGGAEFGEWEGWLLPAHYGSAAEDVLHLRTGAALIDLGPHALLDLVGADVRRFANGMFTNRLRDLEQGHGNRSAMTDEKGKVLGFLDAWCVAEDRLRVALDGVTLAWFEERYGKFIVFDDVELLDLSTTHTTVGIVGPRRGEIASRAGLPQPAPGEAIAMGEVLAAGKDRVGVPGIEVQLPSTDVVTTWEGLKALGATPIGTEAMEAARVRSGKIRWPIDGGERALVHELGVVAECCSFEKGCYIGQEVINRIDVMGQVNKRIVGLRMDEDAIPPVGAEVRVGDTVVGHARSGAREGGVARVLAMLRKSAWEPGTAVTVHAGERVVGAVVSALPFEA